MTANPVLLELGRGELRESRHRGAVAIADAQGQSIFSLGDIHAAVFPRSAIKAIQALQLIESGAADRFGADDKVLALACASHTGSPAHTELVAQWLARIDLTPDDLRCGPHWPLHDSEARALAARGLQPNRLHNNCSGKHAGMLAICRHLGEPIDDYPAASHPVQQRWRLDLAELCDHDLGAAPCGIDGCGIPVIAVPLHGLATAAARFAAGHGGPRRSEAMRRIRAAIARHPELVAGDGFFDTVVMRHLAPTILTKTGAEGVHLAMLTELGLGIAIKIDDGAKRAADAVMAAVLTRFAPPTAEALLADYSRSVIHNYAGTTVGEFIPAAELSATD